MMTRTMMLRAVTSLAILPTTLANAQNIAPSCSTTPAPLPVGMSSFAMPVRLASGGVLSVGRAGSVALIAAPAYAAPPDHQPAAGTFGGLAVVQIASAGRYRVALGSGVWVDVVRDAAPVASASHGHGPACSPIRKMVDFDLRPGRYVIQLSGATARAATLLVVKTG